VWNGIDDMGQSIQERICGILHKGWVICDEREEIYGIEDKQ